MTSLEGVPVFPEDSAHDDDTVFESESDEALPLELLEEHQNDLLIAGWEPDEMFDDSSEDELREITSDLRKRLNLFGVEGSPSHEKLKSLWHEMSMDPFLVEDLVLYVTSDKKKRTRNPLVQPQFEDLTDVSSTLSNPYQVRNDLIDQYVVPNLVRFGYEEKNAYSLTQQGVRGKEEHRRAYRFFGWLSGQDFMEDFPKAVEAEKLRTGRPVRADRLFELATDEVRYVMTYHQTNERKRLFDERISYQRVAYENIDKTLANAVKMCEHVFLGHIKQK